ncbi:FG-GAP-like repeat-containing protein [Stieleria sp. ICT_E10.1]|uniref:FG-GAP-like repeat-containing protein n=1 Tax=Stieleria sedimenti TaxID=2976331 RepID=UPI00217F43F4|nr:FG-GAP-like repeat-containing protein [Stieleria sedimenti]MCS7468985.1 FG-GAP-like repeat-containing protein [Stieleria sedimenti]
MSAVTMNMNRSMTSTQRNTLYWLFGLTVVLACVGCGSGDRATSPQGTPPTQPGDDDTSRLESAFALMQQGQTDQALERLQQVLIRSPKNVDALSLAIELYNQRGEFCQAADLAATVAEIDTARGSQILIRAFDWNLRCGDFAAAEKNLRRAEALDPNNVDVHRMLAQLLNAQGRRFEASRHVRQLIRLRSVQPNETLSLIDLQGPFYLVSFADFVKGNAVTLFSLGEARELYTRINAEATEVLALMQRIREAFPDSAAAAALHGRILAENGRQEALAEWAKNVPEGTQQQPEYWSAIGSWMALQDRHGEAIRAFGEALRRDPTDRESLRSMIQSLVSVGQESRIPELRQRLAALDRIFRIAKDADAEQSLWISQRLGELARPWESCAWLMREAQLSGAMSQRVPELNQRHQAILAWERGADETQIGTAQLTRLLGFDIQQWPLPELNSRKPTRPADPTQSADQGLRFVDVAPELKLKARYVGGFATDGSEFYPYEVNGGGLAVLDYDLDGRCDLYMAQSGGTPIEPGSSMPNQLFRFAVEGGFSDVTEPAAVGDRHFGQGVCVGDVNQDGFPDLLVANVGPNVIYINQGDGTFRDASDTLLDGADNWTSCIGLADLSGDTLPELIEINYIDDPLAYTVRCTDDHLPCQPQRFNAASDRILKLLPNGQFAPWSQAAEMRSNPKLGFGLVVANFDGKLGNDFFVANDGDLNHFWVSTAAAAAGDDRFSIVESAGVRGCSIGKGGDSQACMGVAAGDFDRDGQLDLHVTNFHNESVNLFTQNEPGFFFDESLRYGLHDPSFSVLGFGTQAADFDNDGWLDLAVLNGHVFDARDEGIPFQMIPQLFHGSRQGFQLQDRSTAGEYWQQQQLGRTLATLDWNRDGKMDLVANHLDQPVAMLQNVSASQHWIQFELIGVDCERDAIGAKVRLRAGQDRWSGWQTGGDGYMCSNEPVVHFGVGSAEFIDQVEIRWPDGRTETFENVDTDIRYLAIQGADALEQR